MGETWGERWPGMLIVGSPMLAAAMTLSVALTDVYLLPRADLLTYGAEAIVPINGVLGAIASAAGAVRQNGGTATRVIAMVAAFVWAVAVYVIVMVLATVLVPEF